MGSGDPKYNPLLYTDPSGESLLVFGIGFVVGAYLTGSLYNKDFTPWSTGNGDESWAWDDPEMYVMMGIGGLAVGFGAAMGWGVIAENYAFNMTIGSGIGEAVQTRAQFLVSNSGIVFQGLGYTTAAGGGAFLTNEAIKGINQREMDYGKHGGVPDPSLASSGNPTISYDLHATGANMRIGYTYSKGDYEWFQTVQSNQPFGSTVAREYFVVDNGGNLNEPWYPEDYRHTAEYSEIILYDTPNRSKLIPNMHWEAESSLFEIRENSYHHVTTVRWGFYNSKGRAKGYHTINATPSQRHKNKLLEWIKNVIW